MSMPTASIEGGTTVAVMAPASAAARPAGDVPHAAEHPAAHREQAADRDRAAHREQFAHRDRSVAGTRRQAWRARFGLAEVCGTAAAAAGFAAGYLPDGSLLAAAGLATLGEVLGFYGCIGAKTVAAACRATAHLGGWRRLAAGAWHAVREQLASCAVAEAADSFLIRPGCVAGAAWLLRPLPGGVWLGFAVGKAIADVAWYGMEASARRGIAWSAAAMPFTGRPACPGLRARHHGWLLLVKCVSVSMSAAL